MESIEIETVIFDV